MTAGKENRPGVGTEAIEAQAGGPFAYVSNDKPAIDLIEISKGSANPRYEVYLQGWAAGYESRQSEIDGLKWQRDLWYFVANNKGKRPIDFYGHLTNELWIEAAQ